MNFKEEVKKLFEEKMKKIKEIGKMIISKEVGGEKKEILLGRGEESLGKAAERVYLEEEMKEEKKILIREGQREPSGDPILTLTGHSDHVGNVAFSPNGEYLASGSSDTTIKLWDI